VAKASGRGRTITLDETWRMLLPLVIAQYHTFPLDENEVSCRVGFV
jgi:hypothetical protein